MLWGVDLSGWGSLRSLFSAAYSSASAFFLPFLAIASHVSLQNAICRFRYPTFAYTSEVNTVCSDDCLHILLPSYIPYLICGKSKLVAIAVSYSTFFFWCHSKVNKSGINPDAMMDVFPLVLKLLLRKKEWYSVNWCWKLASLKIFQCLMTLSGSFPRLKAFFVMF